MPDKDRGNQKKQKNQKPKNEKTANDNQWVTTGLNQDKKERRDGPGGENVKK